MASAGSPSSARRVLLLLVVLAGALLALAIVQRDRALQKEYDDAQRRAELYAATVFRNTLGPGDVATPLEGSRRESLFAEVQAYVLTDPTVARIRLWSPDGTLLFSTDGADEPGERSTDPTIASAVGGSVRSRLAAESLSPPPTVGGNRESTPLFQTFAPLRIRGSANVVGAVEVEQFAAALEDRADDPWWLVQEGASGAVVLLALLSLIAVARGMRRPAPTRDRATDDRPSRKKRRDGWGEGEADLRERLDRANARAKEAEAAAQSFAETLQQVSNRLEAVESQSADERVAELKESLRRSEAERAMLRAGRPETLVEAEVRELRGQLRESQSLAKAAEALVAGGGDLTEVQQQLSTAARQVEEAVERAKIAEGRADAAEDRAKATGDLATVAEQRIDLLETKLQEIATGLGTADPELVELQGQLVDARQRADEMERRAAEAESRLAVAGSLDGPAEELLQRLEERVVAAEARAQEAEARIGPLEEQVVEGGSRFRQRLGLSAAGRKLAAPAPAPAPAERESLPEMDLRAAIARGLRGPLTRAAGLTLALQGTIESGEGKAALRQLSSSLRRLDQLAADLHHVHRMIDGSLPLNRRRTDLAALVAEILDDPVTLEERLIRLDADTVHARVDPARARQIVEGMIDAARERTRSGAAIVVRIRETDAGALVSVEDDNRIPASIGAEMSLAVRLAELHGAEITVDGSSFRVVFPKDEGR